jgi:hypothetical protein
MTRLRRPGNAHYTVLSSVEVAGPPGGVDGPRPAAERDGSARHSAVESSALDERGEPWRGIRTRSLRPDAEVPFGDAHSVPCAGLRMFEEIDADLCGRSVAHEHVRYHSASHMLQGSGRFAGISCRRRDSNPRPSDYDSAARTAGVCGCSTFPPQISQFSPRSKASELRLFAGPSVVQTLSRQATAAS